MLKPFSGMVSTPLSWASELCLSTRSLTEPPGLCKTRQDGNQDGWRISPPPCPGWWSPFSTLHSWESSSKIWSLSPPWDLSSITGTPSATGSTSVRTIQLSTTTLVVPSSSAGLSSRKLSRLFSSPRFSTGLIALPSSLTLIPEMTDQFEPQISSQSCKITWDSSSTVGSQAPT